MNTCGKPLHAALVAGSLAAASAAWSAGVDWAALRETDVRLRAIPRELTVVTNAIPILGDRLAFARDARVLELRRKRDAARRVYEAALATPEAGALKTARAAAHRAFRAAIDREILLDAPAFQVLMKEREQTERDRDALAAAKTMTAAEAKRLATLQLRLADIERIEKKQEKALWTHRAAATVWKDEAWREAQWNDLHQPKSPAGDALAGLRRAESELAAAYEEAFGGIEAGRDLVAERNALTREQTALGSRFDALRRVSFGDETLWTRHQATLEGAPGDNAGGAGTVTVDFYCLPHVKIVRGLIVRALENPWILMAAADKDLAFVHFQAPQRFDIMEGEPSVFERGLAAVARSSGHPEVEHLPFLTKGTSAGVLFARDMAFWKPDRCIGVIHHAGGNLQTLKYPDRLIPHVPFLAINGEFEAYGPDGGGPRGIRPEYGWQTQWVMCREQLLRLRRKDENHLTMMAVQPRGAHATWDEELHWIVALFIRKAVDARVPNLDKLPTATVQCLPVRAAHGWLSDARLDHPAHEPAPYDAYKGDRAEAFWSFDKEMADTIGAYHRGEFFLPDFTRKHPVPGTVGWPNASAQRR